MLFVIAFVPVFNSLFQLLNMTYYARWYYMLTMMLSLATILCLDREEVNYKSGLKITYIATVGIALFIGLMPSDSSYENFGLEKYPDRYWAWVGIALVSLVALTIALGLRKNKKVFDRTVAIMLSVLIIGYGNILIGVGVVNSNYQPDFIENRAIGNKDQFPELEDLHSVRSDFYNAMDNMGMYWQIPTIQAFQSIVPGSVMDFYKSVDVERSVGSRPETKVYGIRSFLSCKYLFDYTGDGKSFSENNTTKMPGWKLNETKLDYEVYENEYYIPYGFTYDEYITENQYNNVAAEDRHLLLLKAMVLNNEQAEKYNDILTAHENTSDYRYTEEAYFKDCTERKQLVCSSIEFKNNEFNAKITTEDKAELVFFSIPYEDGWQAEVNGEPVEIEKVNVGFMAVKVPANQTSEIKFTYQTPGLAAGALISGMGIVLFAVYMYLWQPQRRKKDGLVLLEDFSPEAIWYLNMMPIKEEKIDFIESEDKKEPEESAFEVLPDEEQEPPSDENQENGNKRTKL